MSLTFLYVLCSLFGIVSSTDCPDRWVSFRGSCYLFGHDRSLTFSGAEQYCRQHGGHLAHVDNHIENEFLKDFMRTLKPNRYWIGLTDETIEGVWQWYDTQKDDKFFDWFPGEPSNDKEDCVEMEPAYDFKWNDLTCTHTVESLCEIRHSDETAVVG